MYARNTIRFCAVALACAALPALAEVKVVDTQTSGSPLTLKTTFGKVVDAVNIGGSSLKCDDVNFTGQTVPENSTASQAIETTPFNVTISTKKNNLASVVIANGDALFHSEVYSLGFQDLSLKISGLDPNKKYQIQYLHGDCRNEVWARYDEATQTFTDSKGNKTTSTLAFNTEPNKNQYAVVTLEVSGAESVVYDMPHSGKADGRGPSFSGFVILEKP